MDIKTVEEANQKFPIDKVADRLKARILSDDYVQQSLGEKGIDFVDIEPTASWSVPEGWGLTLSVDIMVICNDDQYDTMDSILEDEDRVDNIDTGVGDAVGEVFDEEWASEGLNFNMETTSVYALRDSS